MFGVSSIEIDNKIEAVRAPQYEFSFPNTMLFLTGVSLSGKSTIAPLIAAEIEGCSVQNMDILRIVTQEIESLKPEEERNPFATYGSCDSYLLIGDGSYSPESLIEGFNAYSQIVTSLLEKITPQLQAQGARDMLFEGVQLTPLVVLPYLVGNNRLIIITSDENRLDSNKKKLFGNDKTLNERYQTERLSILQAEILRQSRRIPSDKVMIFDNSGDYLITVKDILQKLQAEGVIK